MGFEQEGEATALQQLVCRSPGWQLQPLTSRSTGPKTAASVDSLPGNDADDSLPVSHPAAELQEAAGYAVDLEQDVPAKLQTLLFFRLHPPSQPAPAQSQPGESSPRSRCRMLKNFVTRSLECEASRDPLKAEGPYLSTMFANLCAARSW